MERLTGAALAAMAILCVLAAFKAGVIALGIWFTATWPEVTGRIHAVYRDRPGRCFLIGLANTAVLGFIGLALLSKEPLALLGLLLLLAVAFLHLWGRAAAYRRMAVKMDLDNAEEGAPRALALGGLVTELTFLVPAIGQVLYLGTTLRGMGAVVIALLARYGGPGAQGDGPHA